MQSTWDANVKEFGKVDICVTGASIAGGAPAKGYPFLDFWKMIDVNLTSNCPDPS